MRLRLRRLGAAQLGLAAALVLQSGCASVVEYAARTQNTSILNPDSVQGIRDRTGFLNQKVSSDDPLDLAAARLRGRDSNTDAAAAGSPPEDRQPCSAPATGSFTFFCKQSLSEASPTDDAKAKDYLATGITLSNELCDAWFERLGVAQVTLRQTADSISATGSLTSAILAFAKAKTEAIGLTASVFGVGKQMTDSLAANYIVAVDLTSTAAAVREYRALYAQKIETAQSSWTYNTARRVVMAYDNTCSALYVRRFVNARVEGSKADAVQQLTGAALNSFLGDWKKYFPVQLTMAQLVDVYAYLYISDLSPALRTKLLEGIPAGLKSGTSIAFAEGTNVDSFRRGLIYDNIDSALKAQALARVEALKAVLTKDAAASAEDASKAHDAADQAAAESASANQDAAQKDAAAKAAAAKVTGLRAGAAQPGAVRDLAAQATLQAAEADAAAKEMAARQAASAAAAKAAVARQSAQRSADKDAQATTARTAALESAASTGAVDSGAGAQVVAVPVDANNRPLDIPPPP